MRCWRLEPCSSTFCSTRWSSSLPCLASRACSSGSGQRTTPTTRRSPPAPVGPWEPPGLPSSSTLGCSACKPVACSVHSPTKLISAWRHNFESTDPPHLLRGRGRHLRVREHVHDRVDAQGAEDRDLLRLPPVLHGHTADRGHRGSGRALPQAGGEDHPVVDAVTGGKRPGDGFSAQTQG